MFKHGANDHWLYRDGKRRNPPKTSDHYVVFDPNGGVSEFQNPEALSKFYKRLRLPLPYKDVANIALNSDDLHTVLTSTTY